MATLTTVQLAERWGMNPGTLANWRSFKRGPVYSKKGTHVSYDLEDIEKFEEASKVTPRTLSRLPPKKRAKKARKG